MHKIYATEGARGGAGRQKGSPPPSRPPPASQPRRHSPSLPRAAGGERAGGGGGGGGRGGTARMIGDAECRRECLPDRRREGDGARDADAGPRPDVRCAGAGPAAGRIEAGEVWDPQ